MSFSFFENLIVDDMTPKQVRYLTPVLPKEAKHHVLDIYQQIRQDFQLVPPLTMLSSSPKLLAVVWAAWREIQVVESKVSRTTLEAIAAAVSMQNKCPYCVDAHTGMLHATSDHDVVSAIHSGNIESIRKKELRSVVQWAFESTNPESNLLKQPPFTEESMPQIIGTTLIYHFVNRLVTIFLSESPLPIVSNNWGLRRKSVRVFGATIAKSIRNKKPKPGASLKFVPQASLPNDFTWAKSDVNISAALAGLAATIGQVNEAVMSKEVKNVVMDYLSSWRGELPGMSRRWLDTHVECLCEEDQAIAKLVLLAAVAPYQVDEKVIEDCRRVHLKEEQLLNVSAWGAFMAARQIGNWLYNSRI